jgi:hypothetical protein
MNAERMLRGNRAGGEAHDEHHQRDRQERLEQGALEVVPLSLQKDEQHGAYHTPQHELPGSPSEQRDAHGSLAGAYGQPDASLARPSGDRDVHGCGEAGRGQEEAKEGDAQAQNCSEVVRGVPLTKLDIERSNPSGESFRTELRRDGSKPRRELVSGRRSPSV